MKNKTKTDSNFCQPWSIIPAVPTTTAIENNHKNKRSNTIATNFQSSFTCVRVALPQAQAQSPAAVQRGRVRVKEKE